MVAERVAEEMEKRKDEIEAEVLRRVEEAKSLMEQQVMTSNFDLEEADRVLYAGRQTWWATQPSVSGK